MLLTYNLTSYFLTLWKIPSADTDVDADHFFSWVESSFLFVGLLVIMKTDRQYKLK